MRVIFILLVILNIFLLFSGQAVAQTIGFPYWGGMGRNEPPLLPCTAPSCSLCHIIQLVQRLAYFLLTLTVVGLAPIFIAVGGFMILGYAGSEERLRRGKLVLKTAVIGTFLALASFIIVNTFFYVLGVNIGGSGSWFSITCVA